MIFIPPVWFRYGGGGGDPIKRCVKCGEPVHRSDRWLERILFDGSFFRTGFIVVSFVVFAFFVMAWGVDILSNCTNGVPLHQVLINEWNFVRSLKW